MSFLALTACGRDGPTTFASTGQADDTYRDPAGWTIDVPPGWRVVPFETSDGSATATGAQLSNVELPAPSIEPGLPIQASGADLPADGVALVIAIDEDASNGQTPPASPPSPPLSLDAFSQGSALPGTPSLSLLWFSGNGQTFLASIKVGSASNPEDQTTLATIVGSLRFD